MNRLSDPVARALIASTSLGLITVAVRHDRVGVREERLFKLLNGLPDRLYHPVWLVMQLGTVGAAPVAAGAAWAAGSRPLAGRLLVSGVIAWALSKAFKRVIRRPRPADLVADTHVRGGTASGLGYLSGHAAVAMALGVAAAPHLGRQGRRVILLLVPSVSLARLYVGAHLPLDVIGGAALGLAVEAATAAAERHLMAVHEGRGATPWPGRSQSCTPGPAARRSPRAGQWRRWTPSRRA